MNLNYFHGILNGIPLSNVSSTHALMLPFQSIIGPYNMF